MKSRMESHFSFGAERFTGFFLGGVFSVSHHCGYEWNRRITSQKNTAVGFVRKRGDGCEVRCVLLKGFLAPPSFLLVFLLVAGIYLFILCRDGFEMELIPLCLPFSFITTLIMALVSAYTESMTEESDEGQKILKSLLLDPTDPFSYLNHRDELH